LLLWDCNPADHTYTADFEGDMQIAASGFAHRYPDNDRVESICLMCLLTVCSCRGVEQMMLEEAKHVCQPDAASPSLHLQKRFGEDARPVDARLRHAPWSRSA